jgi:hypothetical protein
MSFHFDQFAQNVRAGGSIAAADVASLRQWSWSDGVMSEAEALTLFELNGLSKARDPEWIAFFVDSLTGYIVDRSQPRGYITAADAEWVIAQIDHDGRVDSVAEMELIVCLAEKSLDAPHSLKAYALAQVEKIVLSGEGPTRDTAIPANMITSAETAILRRLLFAPGSDGPARISESEAKLLFRLKDACIASDNAPEWQRMFVQGVGNYLMGFSSYQPLTHERAVELERFMNDNKPNVGRFFARMAQTKLGSAFGDFFTPKQKPEPHANAEQAVNEAEEVSTIENSWLNQEMNASSGIDSYEQALLDFITAESNGQ